MNPRFERKKEKVDESQDRGKKRCNRRSILMPAFPESLESRRRKIAPPPSREAMLRSALVGILRRLGLVSHVVPTDLALLALARDFAESGKGLVDDEGRLIDAKPFRFEDCLSLPSPDLDKEIPF